MIIINILLGVVLGYDHNIIEDLCIAPIGVFGPICSSSNQFLRSDSDVIIEYFVRSVIETPVICKFRGMACRSCFTGCCFTLHPISEIGYKIRNNISNKIVWGMNSNFPQIQCKSTLLTTNLFWSWTLGNKTNSGCHNKTNCQESTC